MLMVRKKNEEEELNEEGKGTRMSKEEEEEGKTAEDMADEGLKKAVDSPVPFNSEPAKPPVASTPKVEITGPSVVVENGLGLYIRTYSEEQHGKEFLALAKMFIGKPKNVARGFHLRK